MTPGCYTEHMTSPFDLSNAFNDIQLFFTQANAFRSVLILIAAIVIAYIISKYFANAIIYVAQRVAVHSDQVSNEETLVKLRQVETYLSIAVAGVRAVIVAVVAYLVWDALSPLSSSGAAAIGASAFFVVFAGQTLGIFLRDLTVGATMIIENWFHVGDFIKIEPFLDVSGVVEQFTLRSTKLRSLSGEVVWIHNQQIQAVHVTPRGVRTLAVDVFVRDLELGKKTVKRLISTMPTGPMMLARPLHITNTEKWGDDLWRITVIGETAPGREWLIEKYFVNAIIEVDAETKDRAERIFVHDPIPRFADPIADKKFRRAVRATKGE